MSCASGLGYPPTHGTETAIRPLTALVPVGIQARVKATDILIEGVRQRASPPWRRDAPDHREVDPGFDPDSQRPCTTPRDRRRNQVPRIPRRCLIPKRRWRRIDIGVQLRRTTNGECQPPSAIFSTAGVPTIVTALGPTPEFPDDVMVKLPPQPRQAMSPMNSACSIRNKLRQQRMRKPLEDT